MIASRGRKLRPLTQGALLRDKLFANDPRGARLQTGCLRMDALLRRLFGGLLWAAGFLLRVDLLRSEVPDIREEINRRADTAEDHGEPDDEFHQADRAGEK